MTNKQLMQIAVLKGSRTDKHPTEIGKEVAALAVTEGWMNEPELIGRLCRLIAFPAFGRDDR